ncbi:MAG: hypothetical protein QM764_17740 [Chitinophagaceae bacterium]
MIVERLSEREAERDAVVVARARVGKRRLDAIDVGGIELDRLEIGESPPGHTRIWALGDHAAVLGGGFVGAIADAQHVGEQGARGDVIGREPHGFDERGHRFRRSARSA